MNRANTDFEDIDWNELWRKAHVEKHEHMHDPAYWDKRAPDFTRNATDSDYVGQFIEMMKPQAAWSVLDIGSAAGTLAVPLARSVKRVTAVDPSTTMLKLLADRCHRLGIGNVRIVNGRWEDDWDGLGIGIHDVAIASRSLIVDDLRGAIIKLQSHAARRVYLSTLVDDGPHDRRIVEAVGRAFRRGADYMIVYNLLRRMGIYANVAFTVKRDEKAYRDVQEALDSMRWMLHNMTREEEERLHSYLRNTLVPENGRWRLPWTRIVRWAVMWWDTDWSSRQT